MAGSLEMMRHDIKKCESFMDQRCLIENMGDAWEACEEAIARIEELEEAIKDHFDRQPALNTDDPLYRVLKDGD